MNSFEELSAVDVGAHIERKGKFSYLSWPFAVSELRKRHPTATWQVVKSADGMPFIATGCGVFVEVAVTVEGVTLSQIHPVLNGANKPISEPNAFDINTSIQRCLVKAIALHGLGLYIYAGEDLPETPKVSRISAVSGSPDESQLEPEVEQYLIEGAEFIKDCHRHNDISGAVNWLSESALDDQQETFLWAQLDSKVRTAIKQRKAA